MIAAKGLTVWKTPRLGALDRGTWALVRPRRACPVWLEGLAVRSCRRSRCSCWGSLLCPSVVGRQVQRGRGGWGQEAVHASEACAKASRGVSFAGLEQHRRSLNNALEACGTVWATNSDNSTLRASIFKTTHAPPPPPPQHTHKLYVHY